MILCAKCIKSRKQIGHTCCGDTTTAEGPGGERAIVPELLAEPCCGDSACCGDSVTGTARGVHAGPAGPVGSFCGVSGAGTAAGSPMGNGPPDTAEGPSTGCKLRGDSICRSMHASPLRNV